MEHALIFIWVVITVSMTYKIISGRDDWMLEFFLIIGAVFVINISSKIQGYVDIPTDYRFNKLPLGNSKADKQKRNIHYFVDSVIWAFAFTAFTGGIGLALGENVNESFPLGDILYKGDSTTMILFVGIIVEFIMCVVIFFFMERWFTERHIDVYKKSIAENDDSFDEDDE